LDKKYHITYITTNNITGKQYVGDHSTNNINDNYLGSGILILKAIKKYGKKNFSKEILKICESKEEAFEYQEKYINKFNTLQPRGYNISPKGGHNVKDCFSEETKIKIGFSSRGRKWSDESRRNMGKRVSGEDNPMFGKGYKISGKNNGIYGGHSEEAKEKMRKPKSKTHIKNLSIGALKQRKITCSHCKKEFHPGNFKRHLQSLERKGLVDSYFVLETLRDKELT
jgi:group I intron endonuclease